MAKIYGLNGIIRGRQGNNVFSVQNGTQVLKQYQPAVANPRSDAQTIQRTKFALAGKMSGATPVMAISGLLGSNARDKRARFVEMVLRAATVTTSNGVFRASVPLADVLYSEGALPTYSTVTSVTAAWQGTSIIAQNNVSVSVTPGTVSNIRPEGYSELYVVALYDSVSNNLEVCQVLERGATALSFTLRAGYQHDCFVAVYQIPFVRLSSASRPVSSFVGADETTAFMTATSSNMVAGSEWGRSVLVQVLGILGGENTSHAIAPNSGDAMRDAIEEALMETSVSSRKLSKK